MQPLEKSAEFVNVNISKRHLIYQQNDFIHRGKYRLVHHSLFMHIILKLDNRKWRDMRLAPSELLLKQKIQPLSSECSSLFKSLGEERPLACALMQKEWKWK